jgi:hypothetical protein
VHYSSGCLARRSQRRRQRQVSATSWSPGRRDRYFRADNARCRRLPPIPPHIRRACWAGAVVKYAACIARAQG